MQLQACRQLLAAEVACCVYRWNAPMTVIRHAHVSDVYVQVNLVAPSSTPGKLVQPSRQGS